MHAGNCSFDVFSELHSAKKTGLGSSRQYGETKLVRRNCSVSWALVLVLPFVTQA